MYPDNLFKTWSLYFDINFDPQYDWKDQRDEFNRARDLVSHLTCDVGHSDMILLFDKEIRFEMAKHELYKAGIKYEERD